MGDSLEARISIIEHIQEEFGHDIQEMEGQLVRLTELIEGHTGAISKNTYRSPSFPLQPTLPPFTHQRYPGHGSRISVRGNVPPSVHHLHSSCEPHISIRGNVPSGVHHLNWQPHAPTPAIFPAFEKVSQPGDLASSSENNLGKPRIRQNKSRWDPIPVTYTELLPKLLERQLVALSHVPLTRPPFSNSYDPNVHCDYHAGNPGHSTEDCISFKNKVQALIKIGWISFESPDQPNNLSLNFFETRTEEVKDFATTSKGVQGRKIGYTTEKPEEEKKASELQKENEKLRRLVQDMAYMMTEQKESIAALQGGM